MQIPLNLLVILKPLFITFVLLFKQDILIFGETEDIPIHVSPVILDLKLCFLGGNVQQDSFRVSSTTKQACTLSIKVPPSLAKHIQVDPKKTILQSYSSINFLVRLILRYSITIMFFFCISLMKNPFELCFSKKDPSPLGDYVTI